MSWTGPEGTEGATNPDDEFRIDFESEQERATLMAEIQEFMRHELRIKRAVRACLFTRRFRPLQAKHKLNFP